MSGDFALPVAVLFNSLDDLLVSFTRVVKNERFRVRSIVLMSSALSHDIAYR